MTYSGQGVLKEGIQAHRTIIYSSAPQQDGRSNQKRLKSQDHDQKGDSRLSYTVSANNDLDPPLQVNHIKFYTFENNVRVVFIGNVDQYDHGALKFISTSRNCPDRNLENEAGGGSQCANDEQCGERAEHLYISNEDYHDPHRASLLKHSPETLGVINLVSAAGMGGTFVWLNHTSGPGIHSDAFKWVSFDVPTSM